MATRNADTDRGDGLPDAVVEDLLSVDSRRRALSILAASDEPMIVEDLAAAVIADREGCAASTVPASERAAMVDELFTEHLPKLTATDVLSYNSMLGTVELERTGIAPTDTT